MSAIDELLSQSPAKPVALPDPATRARLRQKQGLTQTQVADALHVKPGTVSAWESTRNKSPRGETRELYAELLRRIAQRFGESTNWEGNSDDEAE